MTRPIATRSPLEIGKWCVYGLALLAPGSFFVLPVIWLVRQVRLAPRAAVKLAPTAVGRDRGAAPR